MDLFILCIEIFFARILDVSMGTVKTIMMVRGKTVISAILGFLEVFIWFLVVKDALSSDSHSLFIVFAYAGGYACGTFIGGIIAKNFIHGKLDVRLTIKRTQISLVDKLREAGYAVSTTNAKGYKNDSKLLVFMEIDDKKLSDVEKIVKEYDEDIFMVVSETKFVQNGYFKSIVK